MALNRNSAISYNKSRLYSQKAIGIIQFFANCKTTGVFDKQTVEAVYKFQQSPLYSFPTGFADGMVGPATLGVIIMELEHAMRKPDATVLRAYAYKIAGEMHNPGKNYPVPPPPENKVPEEEEVSIEDKDKPRQAYLHELRNLTTSGTVLRLGGGPSFLVGGLYLGPKDIRKLLGGSIETVFYIVIQTESVALDPFLVGKIYRQTNRGFKSDIDTAWTAEVGRRSQGGQAMMKKEVELLMGAVCAGVGAYGGFAALTASTMQFLLLNSKDLFAAARGFEALMKVRTVLKANAPEFWKLCVAMFKLSLVKTPEAMWADQMGSSKLAGELVMIVGEAVLLKRVKVLGLAVEIVKKLMLGAFGKLTDAQTIAFAGKDFLKTIREYDPTINEATANKMIAELKDNWAVVGPALTAFKAALDQMVGA